MIPLCTLLAASKHSFLISIDSQRKNKSEYAIFFIDTATTKSPRRSIKHHLQGSVFDDASKIIILLRSPRNYSYLNNLKFAFMRVFWKNYFSEFSWQCLWFNSTCICLKFYFWMLMYAVFVLNTCVWVSIFRANIVGLSHTHTHTMNNFDTS